MDSDVDANALKEVQTTGRFILKRLTEVANKETSCACPCHSKDPERELDNLKQRQKSLENRENERDEEFKDLRSQLNTLTETLDTKLRPQIAQQADVERDILPSSTEEMDKGQQPPVVHTYHASIEHYKSETTVKYCPTAQNETLLGAGVLDGSEQEVATSVKTVHIDRGNGAVELDKPETEVQDSTLEENDKSRVGTWLSKESPSASEVVNDIKESNEKGKQSSLLSKTGSEESAREASSNIRRTTCSSDYKSDGTELGESQSGNDLNDVQMHLYKDKSSNSPIFSSGREVLDITSSTGMGERLQTVSKHGEQHKHISPVEIESGTAQAEDRYVDGSSESDSITSGDNKHADANSTGRIKAGLGTETRIADAKQEEKTDSSVGVTKGKSKSDAVTNRKPKAKANFHKQSLSESLGVKVVEQTEKRTIDFMEWHMNASREETQGRMSGLLTLRGIFTIVCVDISYSMTKGNAWEQSKTFFKDFIESLKHSMNRYDLNEESVALVTFGHKTEVLKRLTNDFSSLQMSFDGISLGGPSPMYGGLLMCTAAAQSTLCGRGANVNGIQVLTKFVLITDGYPTDTNLVAGPDELTPTEQEDTNSQILEVMQKMEGVFDVFCVPVGNANVEFLQLIVSVSDGKLITYKDGRKIGSRLRKTVIAGGGMPSRPFSNGSDDEDIKDILEAAERRSNHRKSSNYQEIKTDKLPQIGSRVRRGPDWQWDNQDGDGPGTVIGHASNDQQIWVEWDNTNLANIYNYHVSNGYDVLITDEPRLPESNGRLAVGCTVKPGKDWQQTTRNVNVTYIGVVIKTLSEGHVQVRWSNKERGDYSYGLNGRKEVEFSPPELPFPTESSMYSSRSHGAQEYIPRLQETAVAQSQAIQPSRNKNKNGVNTNKNVANKNKIVRQ